MGAEVENLLQALRAFIAAEFECDITGADCPTCKAVTLLSLLESAAGDGK